MANPPTPRAAPEIALSNFPARLLVSAASKNRISKPRNTAIGINVLFPAKYFPSRKKLPTHAICMSTVPTAPRIGSELHSLRRATASKPISSNAMYPKSPSGLSCPVDKRTGVRKPPPIPRIATTSASNCTARRNAAAVISDISAKVGTSPKNGKW